MKNILIFGDSITWGSNPHTGGRHAPEDRWPVVLSEGLENVTIVAEGLRGRTTAYSRPGSSTEMSGVIALPILLHSHAPIDVVVIMLGTNDIYEGYPLNIIRDGYNRLVELIRHHAWRLPGPCQPEILLISPPPVTLGDEPDITAKKVAQSEAIGQTIKSLADDLDCAFFDAATVAHASPIDSFHLEAKDSRALGIALRSEVKKLL